VRIENTEVYGFRMALRAMRNPMNSWELGDSTFGNMDIFLGTHPNVEAMDIFANEFPIIGPNDITLALSLIKSGSEHRKFLRQIVVWVDMTLPRYVWQEMDTYKVATVRNSCSTMHKLGSAELTLDDFEDGLENRDALLPLIDHMNKLAKRMKAEKTFDCRRFMKQVLPESFLQKATMTFNYETLLSMLKQRSSHRLREWKLGVEGSICNWISNLPYMAEFYQACQLREGGGCVQIAVGESK